MTLSLGEKIRKHRDAKGYSLDKLAELSGCSKSYLWELENPRPGKKAVKPSAEKLTQVARVLSITTDYLLDEKAPSDDAMIKEAFFRKYNQLDDTDKIRIQEMIELWGQKK